MPVDPPDPAVVQRALEVYLRAAYEGAPAPAHVRSMLTTLTGWAGKYYAAPVFVSDGNVPPNRYALRLGNRHYPHMKLVIERAPDGGSFLFRADTHDRHCCPPEGSPEHGAFVGLMEQNQRVAQQVEADWAAAGIPTFKSWLREDLARRQGGAAAS